MKFYSTDSSGPSSPSWPDMIEPKDPREVQESSEPEPELECTKPCCKTDPREGLYAL